MTRGEALAATLRPLARVVGFVLMVAIAAGGAAVAAFALGSSGSFSIPGLADALGLSALREEVGDLLARVEAPGSVAILTLLVAIGVIALGLALIYGALSSSRPRLLVVSSDERGRQAARRRPLEQAARTLVEGVDGVVAERVRVRPARRKPGGRLELRVTRARTVSADQARAASEAALTSLRDEALLEVEVRSRAFQRAA
ncbi:MAG: hypothetical protein ACRDL3_01035 [Solirubrobacterales bacterium]